MGGDKMHINVRLFASLRLGREGQITLTHRPDLRVKDVIKELNLPLEEISIIMINGRHGNLDSLLEANDRLSFFPAVGGG